MFGPMFKDSLIWQFRMNPCCEASETDPAPMLYPTIQTPYKTRYHSSKAPMTAVMRAMEARGSERSRLLSYTAW